MKDQTPDQLAVQNTGNEWLLAQKHLERSLATADDIPTLHGLHEQAAGVEEFGKRMRIALDELNRLAEFRIRIERKLGAMLATSVATGRPRKASRGERVLQGSTLPPGLSWSKSSRFQRLAAIPEVQVEKFFAEARLHHKVITSNGLLRATASLPLRPRSKSQVLHAALGLSQRVLDCIRRLIPHPDFAIGIPRADVGAAREVESSVALETKLTGNVVGLCSLDPKELIRKLAAERTADRVQEVLLATPSAVHANWFKLVEQQGWLCCFPHQQSVQVAPLLLYLGRRTSGFCLTMNCLGTILGRARSSQDSSCTYT